MRGLRFFIRPTGQGVCRRASHADRICAVQKEAYTVIAEARCCTHKEGAPLQQIVRLAQESNHLSTLTQPAPHTLHFALSVCSAAMRA